MALHSDNCFELHRCDVYKTHMNFVFSMTPNICSTILPHCFAMTLIQAQSVFKEKKKPASHDIMLPGEGILRPCFYYRSPFSGGEVAGVARIVAQRDRGQQDHGQAFFKSWFSGVALESPLR